MIRITRLADYGIMAMTYFARDGRTRSAPELAAQAHLPVPTASKVLKALAKHGLLEAHRGVKGGFSLSRRPEDISVADVIAVFEGPFAMTSCSAHASACDLESRCPSGSNLRNINRVIHDALRRVSLAEMSRPMAVPVSFPAARMK